MEPIIGYNLEDLEGAILAVDATLDEGESAHLVLCTTQMPTDLDLANFVLSAAKAGAEISYPSSRMEGNVAVTEFNLVKGNPIAMIIPVLVPLVTLGVVAFGLVKIESITQSIMPILLVTGGILILGIALLAPRAERVATKVVESGGKIKYLTSTVALESEPLTKRRDEFGMAEDDWSIYRKESRRAKEEYPYPLYNEHDIHRILEKRGIRTPKSIDESGDSESEDEIELENEPATKPSEKYYKSNPPSTISEEGKTFEIHMTMPSKSEADEEARELRDHGDKTKVIPWEGGYAIYRYSPKTELKPWEEPAWYKPVKLYSEKQAAALSALVPYRIVQEHDDGDLTIKKEAGNLWVVTTDGKAFELKYQADNKQLFILVTEKGGTELEEGSVVSLEAIDEANKRAVAIGERAARGYRPPEGAMTQEFGGHWKPNYFIFLPATREPTKMEPAKFAYSVLVSNLFTAEEIEAFSGRIGVNPLDVPDKVWQQVLKDMEGKFVKFGDLYKVMGNEKESGKPLAEPALFKIGERIVFKSRDTGEVIEVHSTWAVVKLENGQEVIIDKKREGKDWWRGQERIKELFEQKPAVIPVAPAPPEKRGDSLEFIPDSPEYLAECIQNCGWREKIDQAFQAAIQRVRG